MGQGEAALALILIREGCSDEQILTLTGLCLLRLVELRIETAMEPGAYRPLSGEEGEGGFAS